MTAIRRIDGSPTGPGRSTAERRTFCRRCDLALLFDPGLAHRNGAVYLCHQRIYAKRNAGKVSSTIAEDQPIRLVCFDRIPQNVPLYDQWLAVISAADRDQRRFGVSL